jgi:putative hydrolase of the HAD superfamily
VSVSPAVRAVSFDFGQTLAELDTGMLSRRLAERGVAVAERALDAHVVEAWGAYARAIRQGEGGHPWKPLMRHLLARAGAPEARVEERVDWLWAEQPARNIWRRPIPGMIELCRDLVAAGVPIGVTSNSEGRLEELAAELGWRELLGPIADSGRFGHPKPDPRIFRHTAERLGIPIEAIVHVGDAWEADVEGALGAGMAAVWFDPLRTGPRALPARTWGAHDAPGLRLVLRDLGLPIPA